MEGESESSWVAFTARSVQEWPFTAVQIMQRHNGVSAHMHLKVSNLNPLLAKLCTDNQRVHAASKLTSDSLKKITPLISLTPDLINLLIFEVLMKFFLKKHKQTESHMRKNPYDFQGGICVYKCMHVYMCVIYVYICKYEPVIN